MAETYEQVERERSRLRIEVTQLKQERDKALLKIERLHEDVVRARRGATEDVRLAYERAEAAHKTEIERLRGDYNEMQERAHKAEGAHLRYVRDEGGWEGDED